MQHSASAPVHYLVRPSRKLVIQNIGGSCHTETHHSVVTNVEYLNFKIMTNATFLPVDIATTLQ